MSEHADLTIDILINNAGSAGNPQPGVPWIETRDVAELVRYLASDRARYVTGSQHVVDAGLLTR